MDIEGLSKIIVKMIQVETAGFVKLMSTGKHLRIRNSPSCFRPGISQCEKAGAHTPPGGMAMPLHLGCWELVATRTVRGGSGSSRLRFGILGVSLLAAAVRAVLKDCFWNLCSLLRSRGGGEGEAANRGEKRKGSGD